MKGEKNNDEGWKKKQKKKNKEKRVELLAFESNQSRPRASLLSPAAPLYCICVCVTLLLSVSRFTSGFFFSCSRCGLNLGII